MDQEEFKAALKEMDARIDKAYLADTRNTRLRLITRGTKFFRYEAKTKPVASVRATSKSEKLLRSTSSDQLALMQRGPKESDSIGKVTTQFQSQSPTITTDQQKNRNNSKSWGIVEMLSSIRRGALGALAKTSEDENDDGAITSTASTSDAILKSSADTRPRTGHQQHLVPIRKLSTEISGSPLAPNKPLFRATSLPAAKFPDSYLVGEEPSLNPTPSSAGSAALVHGATTMLITPSSPTILIVDTDAGKTHSASADCDKKGGSASLG